jgi:hypothetical protein
MKNKNSLDLYKSLIEKNAFFTAALLTKSDTYNNANSLNFEWPEYDKSTFDSMLEFSPVLETEISKRRDEPDKIISYLHFIKNACKKYRYKAISINQLREALKYQTVIDDMIDPLLDCCSDLFYDSSKQRPEILTNITPDSVRHNSKEDFSHKVLESVLPISQHIVCNATSEKIEYYFMILTKEINPATMKPYMTVEDVREFISLNFAACGTAGNQKYFEIGTEVKSTITYFIYQFYMKYDNGNIANKMKYVNLLISNFKMFANDNPQSLLSNMTPSKYPKNKNNVIDIEKYFPKNK